MKKNIRENMTKKKKKTMHDNLGNYEKEQVRKYDKKRKTDKSL